MKKNQIEKEFLDFLKWLKERIKRKRGFVTLGGRACFEVNSLDENRIEIRSGNGRIHRLDMDGMRLVYRRFVEANDAYRLCAGYYTHPHWQDAPNLTVPPWIAAIIRDYHNHKKTL